MAYVISDACVSCGACEAQCPVGCISQGDTQYEIDPDTCISCGSCAGTLQQEQLAKNNEYLRLYLNDSISSRYSLFFQN